MKKKNGIDVDKIYSNADLIATIIPAIGLGCILGIAIAVKSVYRVG